MVWRPKQQTLAVKCKGWRGTPTFGSLCDGRAFLLLLAKTATLFLSVPASQSK